jgi:hypothetical protein
MRVKLPLSRSCFAPRSFTRHWGSPADPKWCLFRIGLIVGYDELNVPAQFPPRDRPRDCGQRVRWRTDGHHLRLI